MQAGSPAQKPRITRVAAYAIVLDEDRILLCRLSQAIPRWEGHWTLPGGGVEFGESPDDTVVREVSEETGLVVKTLGVAAIDSFVDVSGPEDRHGIRILYRVEVKGGALRHEVEGTTDRCDWHRLAEVVGLKRVPLVDIALRHAPNPSHTARGPSP